MLCVCVVFLLHLNILFILPNISTPLFWTTLRDTTGNFIHFGSNEFEASRIKPGSDGSKKGKVYRYCFGVQKEQFSGITTNNEVIFAIDMPWLMEYFEENNQSESSIITQLKKACNNEDDNHVLLFGSF